jgi:hypothetical protein
MRSFKHVTAVVNRKVTSHVLCWPTSTNLEVVSGVDLRQGAQTDLEASLSTKVRNMGQLHMYSSTISAATIISMLGKYY